MKILHLLASPVFSGPLENVVNLALAQRGLGHQVRVAVDRKREEVTSEEPAVPRLQALRLLDWRGLELSVKSSPVGALRDLRTLRRSQVDVVHAHFSHDHWVARLGHPKTAVLVRSVHAPRSLGRKLPAADAYTVPAAALLGEVDHPRVMVLPALVGAEYVRADREQVRRVHGWAGAPLIGMVSTFQASRRHLLALEAFRQLHAENSRARLLLAGDGVMEPVLRARVEELGLGDAVSFLGYLRGTALVTLLQALDEVWVLGLGNDFSARSAAQARACGARVVAVDEGALGLYADVTCAGASPRALLEASRGGARREVSVSTAADIAANVLRLYEAARAARS